MNLNSSHAGSVVTNADGTPHPCRTCLLPSTRSWLPAHFQCQHLLLRQEGARGRALHLAQKRRSSLALLRVVARATTWLQVLKGTWHASTRGKSNQFFCRYFVAFDSLIYVIVHNCKSNLFCIKYMLLQTSFNVFLKLSCQKWPNGSQKRQNFQFWPRL